MTKIEKENDLLWSSIIKIRAGLICQVNHLHAGPLQAHHAIIKRGMNRANMSTIWEVTNGVCLCSKCHHIIESTTGQAALDINNLIFQYIGQKNIDQLYALHNSAKIINGDTENKKLLNEFQKIILLMNFNLYDPQNRRLAKSEFKLIERLLND
jgi:hypothetical protein